MRHTLTAARGRWRPWGALMLDLDGPSGLPPRGPWEPEVEPTPSASLRLTTTHPERLYSSEAPRPTHSDSANWTDLP